jgi:hypothetical protein
MAKKLHTLGVFEQFSHQQYKKEGRKTAILSPKIKFIPT